MMHSQPGRAYGQDGSIWHGISETGSASCSRWWSAVLARAVGHVS